MQYMQRLPAPTKSTWNIRVLSDFESTVTFCGMGTSAKLGDEPGVSSMRTKFHGVFRKDRVDVPASQDKPGAYCNVKHCYHSKV